MYATIKLAVLPFINVSSHSENEYFCDGITDEIINALSRIKELSVTSRTSVFFYKNKQQNIKTIGKELDVDLLIEGSIRFANEIIRVNAQLIKISEDETIWATCWEGRLNSIFSFQDKISLDIADKLRENFGHLEIEKQLVNPQTKSIEAYKNYLKGNYHFLKWNPEDTDKSIRFFNKAIEIDPNHSESFYSLSHCYIFLAGVGYENSAYCFKKALDYINVAPKKETSEAFFALSSIYFWNHWDIKKSLYYTKKATDLNSSFSGTYILSALIYQLAGYHQKAITEINIAIQLNPLSANNYLTKAWVYYLDRNYEQALNNAHEALIKDDRMISSYSIIASVYVKKHQYQQIIDLFGNETSPYLDLPTKLGFISIAQKQLGLLSLSMSSLAQLKTFYKETTSERALIFIFLFYAVDGSIEEALVWLKKCLDVKIPLLLCLINDPLLDPIHNQIDFKQLTKTINTSLKLETVTTIKKEKILVDAITAKKWKQEISSLMQNEQAFLDPKLTLRDLAKILKIHPNQLSYILNLYFNQNFNEYVNLYRLEYFVQLLKKGQNNTETFMGLAYDSGFNSKTAFYNFFKKHTGLTPKQYIKSKL